MKNKDRGGCPKRVETLVELLATFLGLKGNPKGPCTIGHVDTKIVMDLDTNPTKSSNKKAKLVCWNCNKPGHFKNDCRLHKVNKDGAGPNGSKDPKKQQG
uniref:CCHC-type domain-containing protein n=1 Tax=Lactuca sativa TaxID=4236 RepID=A0A9R1VJ62_LACSA|nr:hypothetical protein LSAT_V11C500263900 [Lactuca sativa]